MKLCVTVILAEEGFCFHAVTAVSTRLESFYVYVVKMCSIFHAMLDAPFFMLPDSVFASRRLIFIFSAVVSEQLLFGPVSNQAERMFIPPPVKVTRDGIGFCTASSAISHAFCPPGTWSPSYSQEAEDLQCAAISLSCARIFNHLFLFPSLKSIFSPIWTDQVNWIVNI